MTKFTQHRLNFSNANYTFGTKLHNTNTNRSTLFDKKFTQHRLNFSNVNYTFGTKLHNTNTNKTTLFDKFTQHRINFSNVKKCIKRRSLKVKDKFLKSWDTDNNVKKRLLQKATKHEFKAIEHLVHNNCKSNI